MPIPILTFSDRGADVKELHSGIRKLGLSIPRQEISEQIFGVGTRDAILKLQARFKLRRTGFVDEDTAAALKRAVAQSGNTQHRIEGRILFDQGQPADGVTLRLYHHGFGGDGTRIGEIETDEQGFYAMPYELDTKAANLEIRAVNADGNEISLSDTKVNAEPHEVLNLVVLSDIKPQAAEFDRLTGDLEKQIGDISKLKDARENAEHQDLTLLRQSTGWDARLIALAATSLTLADETELSPQATYALVRVGLPSDKQQLALVS